MKKRELIERVGHDPEEQGGQPKLSRVDWLEKALDMLIASGVDSVRITKLADALGVTRGSFYWHFADRSELLAAMLEVWAQSNTANIVHAATHAETLQDGILALFNCWLDPELFDPALDFAVRDWARGDDALQAEIAKADGQRMDALIAMFAAHGFPQQQAIIRARNFYYTQMGYYALNVREPLAVRLGYLPTYFETYTDEKLDPAAEAAFRAQVMARAELWGQEVPPAG